MLLEFFLNINNSKIVVFGLALLEKTALTENEKMALFIKNKKSFQPLT